MRGIKFRAWNQSIKRFTHFPAYVLTGDWKDKMGLFFEASDDVYLTAYTEPMQYTGLIDKKGKPIFEGDILATPHFLDVGGWRYLHHVVEWSDKYSGWWCRNVTGDHDDDGSIQLWVYAKKDFEVAGNIYENPELLTK